MEGKNALVEDLAARHGERLRRFLRSRVRNSADIPDIIQEVFLRLLRVPNHKTIRAPEAFAYTPLLLINGWRNRCFGTGREPCFDIRLQPTRSNFGKHRPLRECALPDLVVQH